MIMIWSTVNGRRETQSLELNKQKRSTTNLEYVMSVLEEQGRLDEVDEGLLHRIQLTIQQNKGQRKVEKRVGKQSPILNKPPTTPSHSVLNLARARQQQLFGARRPQLAEQHSRFPFSHEAERVGGQCQAFKTENAILKKQLLAAQTKLQQVGPVGNINQLRRNQVLS